MHSDVKLLVDSGVGSGSHMGQAVGFVAAALTGEGIVHRKGEVERCLLPSPAAAAAIGYASHILKIWAKAIESSQAACTIARKPLPPRRSPAAAGRARGQRHRRARGAAGQHLPAARVDGADQQVERGAARRAGGRRRAGAPQRDAARAVSADSALPAGAIWYHNPRMREGAAAAPALCKDVAWLREKGGGVPEEITQPAVTPGGTDRAAAALPRTPG